MWKKYSVVIFGRKKKTLSTDEVIRGFCFIYFFVTALCLQTRHIFLCLCSQILDAIVGTVNRGALLLGSNFIPTSHFWNNH